MRVAALAIFTLAMFLQPEQEDAVDDRPPFVSEIGSPLFVLIVAVIAAIFAFDVIRTWWQTNEWRRERRRQRR